MRNPPPDTPAAPQPAAPQPATFWLYLPTAVVVVATLAAGTVPAVGEGRVVGDWLPRTAEMLGWSLVGALAALHRPRAGTGSPAARRNGAATLGLGTLALAPAAERLGAVTAAWTGCLAFLLAEASRSLLQRGRVGTRREGRRRPGRAPGMKTGQAGLDSRAGGQGLWERLAPPAAATLAGVAVYSLHFRIAVLSEPTLADSTPGFQGMQLISWGSPIVAYLLAFAALYRVGTEIRRRLGGRTAAPGSTARWSPLALDAGGWILGLVLVGVAHAPGQAVLAGGAPSWAASVCLAAALALLAAEAARQAALRGRAEGRVAKLEKVQKAHARILGEASDVRALAQQILSECRRVLPVEWFQLELIDVSGKPAAGRTSWSAGPGGVLFEGLPEPPDRPGALPGIHRRASWKILERPLEGEGEILAVVRLWCDPRRVQADAEDLFSSLVPQMSSSVHRAHLEREAHLDPLTQVPMRRSLERRLANAYHQVCNEGGTMAVIMCDLDFFKKINDTYGHAAGDQALIAVARSLEEHRREDDFCCRYGGEEFALLLERMSGDSALQLAERLRQGVEAIELVYEEQEIPLRLSAGVAAFPEVHVREPGELLQLADDALYQAKEQGRNRCLLNLGRGRFRTVSGSEIGSAEAPGTEIPRIFG